MALARNDTFQMVPIKRNYPGLRNCPRLRNYPRLRDYPRLRNYPRARAPRPPAPEPHASHAARRSELEMVPLDRNYLEIVVLGGPLRQAEEPCRNRERNVRVRSSCGFEMTCSGGPISANSPSSMK